MHADTYIPRRLDDQWKIGFWDVDVAAPLLFGLFMGYMSGSKISFVLCIATGLFTSRWIARIKALVGFVGFVVALISLAALRNFGPVLFYVGLAIFAAVGLVIAGAIMGAVI